MTVTTSYAAAAGAAAAREKFATVAYDRARYRGKRFPWRASRRDIPTDNGVALPLGTNFSEPWRYRRTIGNAFNQLNVQRNGDFLNEMGEGASAGW